MLVAWAIFFDIDDFGMDFDGLVEYIDGFGGFFDGFIDYIDEFANSFNQSFIQPSESD